jgi:hypothetical protein
MSVDLLVNGEVRGVLEDADLERLSAMAAAGYECVACGTRGGADDGAAAVVVLVQSGTGVVRLAHARCSAPGVVDAGGLLAAPGEASMSAKAAVVDGRPLLIAELVAAPVAVLGDGERDDLMTGALLRMGLHLLASPWEPAPESPGWLVTIAAAGTVLVSDPDGGAFYDGGLDMPGPWLGAVSGAGRVELVAGVAGTAGVDGAAGNVAALESAARAGRLVGATVRATVAAVTRKGGR